jgi:hypothetical protein
VLQLVSDMLNKIRVVLVGVKFVFLVQDVVDHPEVTVFIRVVEVITVNVVLQVFVALDEPKIVQHGIFDCIKTCFYQ